MCIRYIKRGMAMINLNPIGVVCSTRQEVKDDQWDAEESFINLDAAQFSPEVLDGIEDWNPVHGQRDGTTKKSRLR